MPQINLQIQVNNFIDTNEKELHTIINIYVVLRALKSFNLTVGTAIMGGYYANFIGR